MVKVYCEHTSQYLKNQILILIVKMNAELPVNDNNELSILRLIA